MCGLSALSLSVIAENYGEYSGTQRLNKLFIAGEWTGYYMCVWWVKQKSRYKSRLRVGMVHTLLIRKVSTSTCNLVLCV